MESMKAIFKEIEEATIYVIEPIEYVAIPSILRRYTLRYNWHATLEFEEREHGRVHAKRTFGMYCHSQTNDMTFNDVLFLGLHMYENYKNYKNSREYAKDMGMVWSKSIAEDFYWQKQQGKQFERFLEERYLQRLLNSDRDY